MTSERRTFEQQNIQYASVTNGLSVYFTPFKLMYAM